MDIRELETMPFDRTFVLEGGREELCHSSGYEVVLCGMWWNEYQDSEGNYHYGR